MSIYDVIDSKVVKHAEIVVCLFDHCNLKCSFCPQNHNNTQGASEKEILSKVSGIVNWINDNTRSTEYKIHIMGGELFQDCWIENNFLEYYKKFIDEIRKNADTNKKIIFNFITNLVFTKTAEVKTFLNENKLKFSVSYDSKGRFNSKQFKIFKQNIEIFREDIELVSLVITKQNIKEIICGDSYFDYLYSHFRMHWDSFLPSNNLAEKIMPSETELLGFYTHLVDNYPNTINCEPFLTPTIRENRMGCTRGNSYTVMYDNTVPSGCSGSSLLRDGKTENTSTGEIVIKFFNQYDCFSCEYFKRCPFTCFIQNDYNKINRDLGKCVFKETFKYVESKNV